MSLDPSNQCYLVYFPRVRFVVQNADVRGSWLLDKQENRETGIDRLSTWVTKISTDVLLLAVPQTADIRETQQHPAADIKRVVRRGRGTIDLPDPPKGIRNLLRLQCRTGPSHFGDMAGRSRCATMLGDLRWERLC